MGRVRRVGRQTRTDAHFGRFALVAFAIVMWYNLRQLKKRASYAIHGDVQKREWRSGDGSG